MIYYSEWDLVFSDIMKNGSNLFTNLYKYVLGREADKPFFEREPKYFITVVRNPYDRLVSQFYHINKMELTKMHKYSIHFPFFRKWVKQTYENGYDGNDGHYYSQSHIIQYYEYPLPYKVFKLEELIPHQIFYFLDLTDEQKADIDVKFLEIRNELDLNIHHANKHNKQGLWQSFHNSETIRICNKYFANDFKAFDYPMIDASTWQPPKKNII